MKNGLFTHITQVIHFPKGNRFSAIEHERWRGKRDTIRGIFHVVSRFPLHFILYRGNFDYFLAIVCAVASFRFDFKILYF